MFRGCNTRRSNIEVILNGNWCNSGLDFNRDSPLYLQIMRAQYVGELFAALS